MGRCHIGFPKKSAAFAWGTDGVRVFTEYPATFFERNAFAALHAAQGDGHELGAKNYRFEALKGQDAGCLQSHTRWYRLSEETRAEASV